MAQCTAHLYWWHANVHQHIGPHLSRSKVQALSQFVYPPFFSRTVWEDFMLPFLVPESGTLDGCKQVVCFRDDDSPFPEVERDLKHLGVRTNLEVRFSPWAVSMISGIGKVEGKRIKESVGGPPGGKGGDDDGGDGDGSGGGGDDDGEEYIFLLPVLTLAFAAFHLGYCVAVWVKDDSLDNDFIRTGLGLFCLLALAAIRLNSGAEIDAYILGLGASLGVMAWTGERCFLKKEGSPAGIVTLFAASMATMYTAALYHNL